MRTPGVFALLWLTLALTALVFVSCGPPSDPGEPIPSSRPTPVAQEQTPTAIPSPVPARPVLPTGPPPFPKVYHPGDFSHQFFQNPSGVYSSPAVANGVVYVGSFFSYVFDLGYVYALDASTGASRPATVWHPLQELAAMWCTSPRLTAVCTHWMPLPENSFGVFRQATVSTPHRRCLAVWSTSAQETTTYMRWTP